MAEQLNLFPLPPARPGILRGEMMLQALPSIVAAMVLSPPPGSTVLDMCAAPGGKTTLLAQIMGGQGKVVAIDCTAAKVSEIKSLAADMDVGGCVEVYQGDAVHAVQAAVQVRKEGAGEGGGQLFTPVAPEQEEHGGNICEAGDEGEAVGTGEEGSTGPQVKVKVKVKTYGEGEQQAPFGPPPYPPGTFDYILLDPPCSALGLRPRLLHAWSLKQLVYCTCTINPDENEANVAWALDRFSGSLELLPADPLLGLTGLTGADPESGNRWLSEREAALVQRFDPGWLQGSRRRRMAQSPMPPDGEMGETRPAEALQLQPQQPGKEEEEEAGGGKGRHISSGGEERGRGGDHADHGGGGGGGGEAAGGGGPTGLREEEEEEEEEGADDVMGFFIARFRKTAAAPT
ncbi:hypothetical protein VOLCADRAFT_100142 [Volvox carteri f. nagariensis]|uniref:SAM-dependent MTase RsmB/NOP-type domain-containing protein n=1 Tax=Volvox carteri f. nagariensis TaxID=3068 RepID=D8UJI6_VOLCA|nr:uncharacterized protein VOLCADRAFT_100142 [Volvox carteri f. nagariensis]EFJ40115.1 hypothetical protein VOLCADRAFT_100142 [Volvox carteri f. nagariensis]|eukprot:XP_002958811.1 hypothetical protein VOLCADRAFT_100142 [Volvox carteri f. nagariensis]